MVGIPLSPSLSEWSVTTMSKFGEEGLLSSLPTAHLILTKIEN
jgi:hypothetical protein